MQSLYRMELNTVATDSSSMTPTQIDTNDEPNELSYNNDRESERYQSLFKFINFYKNVNLENKQ